MEYYIREGLGGNYIEKIKKAVEEFNMQNGNNEVRQKDLLIYIMTKIDNLPCDKVANKVTKNSTWLAIFKWYIPISISIILALIGLYFRK